MTKPLTIIIDIIAAGGVALSFLQKTLPAVQWSAAALGSAWFIYQFYQAFKKK